jgi:hypothetical protein
MTQSEDEETAALQTCLAAEHAAVYAYGVIGGRLAGLRPSAEVIQRADGSYEWHRTQRDTLDSLVREAGGDPIAADPAYELPLTPDSVGQCARLARYLENRCSEAYGYAVSLAAEPVRGTVAAALGACAVRAVTWGARLTAFPGRPDL